MSEIYTYLLEQINMAEAAFCRFITANDVSLRSHQKGFLVSKSAAPILFDSEQIKDRNNIHKDIKILWQNKTVTNSRAHYYGAKKNELRVTRFGRNFPYLKEEAIGSLLVMCKIADDNYTAVFLSDDEDIEDFYSQYNIASGRKNYVLKGLDDAPNVSMQNAIQEIVERISEFPKTMQMSELARNLYNKVFRVKDRLILRDPDKYLLKWIDTEYELFRNFEEKVYQSKLITPFPSCQALIDFSKVIQNRRRSRAGKSLEHHLADIFTRYNILFSEQKKTEYNNKPDFLFPGIEEYNNDVFPKSGLTFLGAKTTCKDRWRQVLNEAGKIDHKFLFTLQKGVSVNQIREMTRANLSLVIPSYNMAFFPKEVRDDLLSLNQFVKLVKEKQNKYKNAGESLT